MTIDLKTVKHISKLARISLEEKKAEKLADDMNSIFEFIEKLNELKTENVEPLTSIAETTLRFREDKITSDNIREKILRIKQIVQDGMLKTYALPKETEDQIVLFVDEYKRQLREISLRTVLKIADLAKAFPENWKEMAKNTVLRPV